MGKGTFRGGIHPYEGKELSKDLPVLEIAPRGEMVYAMSQHIGAPAVPIVSVGDTVLVGQKIAEAGDQVSSCIVSSVSGKVKAIEPRLAVNGMKVLSIIVENDFQDRKTENYGKGHDPKTLTKEEIIDIIKEAGIVGMGGAGFPTHIKLMPEEPDKIEYILVNGSECEPYLTSDYRIMLEETEKLIGGLKIMIDMFPNAKGIICVEDNKPDAIDKLKGLVNGEEKISVRVLKTKYPQGTERNLIYAATGRKLNSKMLPSDVGCIVDNVDTVCAIYRAVVQGIPLIYRTVTITGDAVRIPRNYRVRIGTSHEEIIEAAGGFVQTPKKIISGGPMMGQALYNTNVPVIKTSSAIVALLEDDVEIFDTTSCIRCGKCVEACPSRLVPQKMMHYAEKNDFRSFEAIGGMECCECGSCTYACPAGRKLTQAFKYARRAILEELRSNTAEK